MPPIPWSEIATTRDLAALETRISARFDHVDARFEHVDARFEQLDARLDLMEGRFGRHDDRFDQLERYISNEFIGLEGRLSMRLTEAVRLVVVSIVLLFAGILGLAATYLAAGS